MNGDEITSERLRAAGFLGDDAAGYYPPDLRGSLLVELRELVGSMAWQITAHRGDLSILGTATTMGQVKAACEMITCSDRLKVEDGDKMNACGEPRSTREASHVEVGVDGSVPADQKSANHPECQIARILLGEWARRQHGRVAILDESQRQIRLQHLIKDVPDRLFTFTTPRNAEAIARDVLWSDLAGDTKFLEMLSVFCTPPRAEFKGILHPAGKATGTAECSDDAVKCGSGSKEAEPTADSVAMAWLADGKAAGEVRMVSCSHRSDGSGWLIVSAKPASVKDSRGKFINIPTFVRRSFFAEDELPFLRSAIRELQEVHKMGADPSHDTGCE